MKDRRIVVSSKPVTTIHVSGKPHHFFHSEALGACRAILIAEDANLPRTEKSHRQMVEETIDEMERDE